MKVNDIVVLKNGLNSFYLVLEMEKHLFEIVKIDDDVARLKSLSTGVEVNIELESIRLATLKEIYLRDGNSVIFNGKPKVVVGDLLVGLDTGFMISYIYEDLTSQFGAIDKVFLNRTTIFKDRLEINETSKIIWQRKPKIELTDDEKVILRNLKVVNDGISKYISRNKNNKLLLRENKDDNYVLPLSNFNHLFKSITHESGIHEIKELLK